MNLDPATGLLTAGRAATAALARRPKMLSPYDSSIPGFTAPRPTTPYAGGDPITATLNAPPSPVTNPASGFAALPSPDSLYQSIQADPLYQQTHADIAASRVSDLASRSAARQRALTLYGAVPDFSAAAGGLGLVGGDIGTDVTDATRQLAQQNTDAGLSTTARLDQTHQDAIRQIKDALTARGLLSSGETGYQLGRHDTAYRQAGSDALQQLLDLLAGFNNSYLTAEQQRQAALSNAAAAAAYRIPPPDSVPVTPPPPPPPADPAAPVAATPASLSTPRIAAPPGYSLPTSGHLWSSGLASLLIPPNAYLTSANKRG